MQDYENNQFFEQFDYNNDDSNIDNEIDIVDHFLTFDSYKIIILYESILDTYKFTLFLGKLTHVKLSNFILDFLFHNENLVIEAKHHNDLHTFELENLLYINYTYDMLSTFISSYTTLESLKYLKKYWIYFCYINSYKEN